MSTQDYEGDRRRAAALRSYMTPAVLTLVLYFVAWLPGIIANIVYLQSASRDKALTGQDPEGKGCLTALLWGFTIVPVALGVLAVCAILLLSASGSGF